MSASKYHISSNGSYAPCVATVRACKLGGHIYADEYVAAKESGDPRFTTGPEDSGQFTKAAELQFAQTQKEYDESLKRETEYNKDMKAWEEQNGRPGGRPILYPTVDRVGKNALNQVNILLQRHGVNPAKAKFIVQDTPVSGPDAYLPPVKKKDKFDADIEAKTTAAREEAQTDDRIKIARDTLALYQEQREWERQRVEKSLALRREHKVDTDVVSHRLNLAHQYLAVRRGWAKNGVPAEAHEVHQLSELTPEQTAVDKDGSISNVWYASTENGSVQKVVSYVPPSGAEYGSEPGYFLTEDGTKIQNKVRYHSYRREETDPAKGNSRILVGPVPAGAKTYQAEKFSTFGELDSGG